MPAGGRWNNGPAWLLWWRPVFELFNRLNFRKSHAGNTRNVVGLVDAFPQRCGDLFLFGDEPELRRRPV